jgi:hypothetical protein
MCGVLEILPPKGKEAPQQFDAYQCPRFRDWDGKTNWQGSVSQLTEPADYLSIRCG